MNKILRQFIFISAVIALVSGLFYAGLDNTPVAQAQTSSDGIAVRVMPNPNSISPTRWYLENIKNQGSPSQLMVDGYQAVRDGRSVYVSAANIQTAGTPVTGIAPEQLYINIYIISYTQALLDETEENSATADIFGQLLNNWTFNVNILDASTYGKCQKIKDNSETGAFCFVDTQCGYKNGEYCASVKAYIVRDVKRLADIRDIETHLNNYYKTTGKYPKLEAGSYLPQKSISVWPSWQETLGASLGVTLPVDPLNKLRGCVGLYDPNTCWDKTKQKFNGIIPNELPLGNVYQYISQNEGKSYQLCAVMETAYTSEFKGACGVKSGAGVVAKPGENKPPVIVAPGLIVLAPGEKLNKYITLMFRTE